jgi:hypothetical protein
MKETTLTVHENNIKMGRRVRSIRNVNAVEGIDIAAQGKVHDVPLHLYLWKDTIKIGLREMELGDMDWIHLAKDRNWWMVLMNTVMYLRVP